MKCALTLLRLPPPLAANASAKYGAHSPRPWVGRHTQLLPRTRRDSRAVQVCLGLQPSVSS
jgi:hypothetical protein